MELSYAGLPAGFSVAEQPKAASYHGLPAGFEVQGQDAASGWGDALAAAPAAALGEIGNAISGTGHFLASLPQDPLGYKIGRGIKALPGAVAHELGGMTQYVRNLSQPEYRGDAPTYEGGEAQRHPWLALTQGDTAPMQQAVATRPLGLMGDVAGVAGLTAPGRAVLGKIADAGMAPPRALGRKLADMTPANRAENALLEASRAGGNNPAAIAALLDTNKSTVPGVGFSAAQAAQDPGMIALERRSRINPVTSPGWANFDAAQNTGMFNAMQGVVNPANDAAVVAARSAREAATKYQRQAALALADQGSLEPLSGFPAADVLASKGLQARDFPEQFSGPVRDTAAAELVGDRGVLPAVQKTGNYVLGAVPDTGATAGRTYEVRKLLADALNARTGQPLDEIASAAKSADTTSRLVKNSIDSALDKASGGAWREYLSAFAANSKDVNSVQALNNIRADLQDKIAGGMTDLNGNPKLSRAYINQVIERHSSNKYGDLIAPAEQARLDAVRATAQQIEAPQANYRMSATGGGSNTAHDLALAGAGHLARALGPVGRVASAVSHAIAGPVENAGATRLGALLQSQADAASALRAAAAREAKRKATRSNGVTPAALAAILAAQPQQ